MSPSYSVQPAGRAVRSHQYEKRRLPGEVSPPVSLPGWRGAGSALDWPERVPELPRAPERSKRGRRLEPPGAGCHELAPPGRALLSRPLSRVEAVL